MISYRGRVIPQTFEEIVDPRHTVLIIHELLNDFCARGGAFDKLGRIIDVSGILAGVQTLIAEARRLKIKLVYVRYTNHADYSTLSDPMIARQYDAIMNPNSPPPSSVDGTWGWENLDEVKPQPGDTIVRKYRVDAFIGTNLDHILRWNGIRTIVILGAGAEAGIVPTVTHAFNLGYFVVAVGDCIRATEPAWLDDAMKFIGRSATVTPHDEIIDAWRSRSPA